MVNPVIPLFLVGALGGSATSLGWVDGVAAAVIAMMTAWAGWRSDRVNNGARRRVPWVRWGYGLPIVGKGLLAVAFAWPMVVAGRTVDRIGKGLRSGTRDALIIDAISVDQRGRAFGFHRAMDSAGSVVGVLVAAALLWWLIGSPAPVASQAAEDVASGDLSQHAPAFRMIFGVAAGLGVIAWGLTFLIRESPVAPAAPARAEMEVCAGGAGGATSGPFGLPGVYWRTVAIMLVFSLANSSDAFLMLRAVELGLAPWAVALAYAVFMLTQAVFAQPAGVLSDRIGRWWVLGAGWTIYAGVYVGFAFTGAAGVWPLLALYGFSTALTDGVTKAVVSDHAPPARRGAAMGIFHMFNGIVTLIASVTMGVLWDRYGHAAAFGFGAIVALLAVVLIPVLRSRGR